MPESADRALLESIEAQLGPDADAALPLVYVAAQHLSFDEVELHAARRRAMLVLAAGGDPHRALDLDAPAVRRLAADLDEVERRAELTATLADLRTAASGLRHLREAADRLLGDVDLAWSSLALVLLAEDLEVVD